MSIYNCNSVVRGMDFDRCVNDDLVSVITLSYQIPDSGLIDSGLFGGNDSNHSTGIFGYSFFVFCFFWVMFLLFLQISNVTSFTILIIYCANCNDAVHENISSLTPLTDGL